jgi:hypothetical protein
MKSILANGGVNLDVLQRSLMLAARIWTPPGIQASGL